MKIVHWALYGFKLKLKNTIRVAGKPINMRDGLILETVSEDGRKGYGEISPLPGWQSENLAVIPDFFKRHSTNLLQRSTNPEWQSMHRDAQSPAVRFALECATFTLNANHSAAATIVPVNALLQSEKAVHECMQKKKQGFTHFKLKIGRGLIENDIASIHSICQLLDESCVLRLDANRNLNYASIVEIWQNIPQKFIDYFEEPVADPQELTKLIKNTNIPVAVDESVHARDICDLDQWHGATAVVLKPQIIQSIERLRLLTASAHKNNMAIVFSDIYSSGIGLRINALLNIHLVASMNPAGLDTYSNLADDVLRDRWEFEHGKINFGSHWPELNHSVLEKVAEGGH